MELGCRTELDYLFPLQVWPTLCGWMKAAHCSEIAPVEVKFLDN